MTHRWVSLFQAMSFLFGETLGSLVQGYRLKRPKYSQAALARDIDVNHSFVTRIENDSRATSADVALRLISALETSPIDTVKLMLLSAGFSPKVVLEFLTSYDNFIVERLRAVQEGKFVQESFPNMPSLVFGKELAVPAPQKIEGESSFSETSKATPKETGGHVFDSRYRYRKIADELINAISSGQFLPGESLPTATDLAGRFSASLVTVHQALNILKRAGLVISYQGIGAFVRPEGDLKEFKPRRTDKDKVPAESRAAKVADAIRAKIQSGEFWYLPAQSKMCQEFGCNMLTLREALDTLWCTPLSRQ